MVDEKTPPLPTPSNDTQEIVVEVLSDTPLPDGFERKFDIDFDKAPDGEMIPKVKAVTDKSTTAEKPKSSPTDAIAEKATPAKESKTEKKEKKKQAKKEKKEAEAATSVATPKTNETPGTPATSSEDSKVESIKNALDELTKTPEEKKPAETEKKEGETTTSTEQPKKDGEVVKKDIMKAIDDIMDTKSATDD